MKRKQIIEIEGKQFDFGLAKLLKEENYSLRDIGVIACINGVISHTTVAKIFQQQKETDKKDFEELVASVFATTDRQKEKEKQERLDKLVENYEG